MNGCLRVTALARTFIHLIRGLALISLAALDFGVAILRSRQSGQPLFKGILIAGSAKMDTQFFQICRLVASHLPRNGSLPPLMESVCFPCFSTSSVFPKTSVHNQEELYSEVLGYSVISWRSHIGFSKIASNLWWFLSCDVFMEYNGAPSFGKYLCLVYVLGTVFFLPRSSRH